MPHPNPNPNPNPKKKPFFWNKSTKGTIGTKSIWHTNVVHTAEWRSHDEEHSLCGCDVKPPGGAQITHMEEMRQACRNPWEGIELMNNF